MRIFMVVLQRPSLHYLRLEHALDLLSPSMQPSKASMPLFSTPPVPFSCCSAYEWDRFMRFMERYANEQGMGFNKS
jgi:hypothetical protein